MVNFFKDLISLFREYPGFFWTIISAVVLFIFTLGKLWERLYHVGKEVDKIHDDIGTVKKETNSINTNVTRLISILQGKGIIDSNMYFQVSSPMQLTNAGKKMLEECGFFSYFEKYKDILLKEIKKKKPKTKYDIEQIAKDVIYNADMTVDEFVPIKEYAFQHGSDLSNMLIAFSLYLRDYAIEEILENK
ncbi:MAG: hypothetical protein ABIH71_08015 [Candidatus Omnitrophota bacterium]|nr:hypothetical protein [Candidatus Omnitrophota bacterium]